MAFSSIGRRRASPVGLARSVNSLGAGGTVAAIHTFVGKRMGRAPAAEFIQKAVGGDLFEIEADRAYSEDHMVLIKEAKQELENGTRVPAKSYPDLSRYDTVYLSLRYHKNTHAELRDFCAVVQGDIGLIHVIFSPVYQFTACSLPSQQSFPLIPAPKDYGGHR